MFKQAPQERTMANKATDSYTFEDIASSYYTDFGVCAPFLTTFSNWYLLDGSFVKVLQIILLRFIFI